MRIAEVDVSAVLFHHTVEVLTNSDFPGGTESLPPATRSTRRTRSQHARVAEMRPMGMGMGMDPMGSGPNSSGGAPIFVCSRICLYLQVELTHSEGPEGGFCDIQCQDKRFASSI